MLRAVGVSRYCVAASTPTVTEVSSSRRVDPWVSAVESRWCQSLLRSSHIRSVGASRYCVAPSTPTVTEIPSSRRVDPWGPAVESRGCQSLLCSSLGTHGYRDTVFQTGLIRGCQLSRSAGASRYCVAPSTPTVTEVSSSRRVDPWVPAVETRGCQSLLRSSLGTHGYRGIVFQTGWGLIYL